MEMDVISGWSPGGSPLLPGLGRDSGLREQVVASVARMFLDSICIVLAGETPKNVGFWFGHCQDNTSCVAIGLSEFVLAWLACSYFVWRYHETLVDPACNPYATFMSWQIIIGAAEWLPISIMTGKVNMVIEYGHFSVSKFINPILVVMVTVTFSYVAHVVMTYTQNAFEPGSYLPFAFLHLIYCFGFATGFAWWTIVRGIIDIFPDWGWLNAILCIVIITFAVRFYLTYGPEPIIPRVDASIHRGSFKRSLLSFLVYSSMILIVMSLVEPSHGLFKQLVSQFHDYEFPDRLDFLALFLMLLSAVTMILIGSVLSTFLARRVENVGDVSISVSRSQMERRSTRLVPVPEHEPIELASTNDAHNDFTVVDLDSAISQSTISTAASMSNVQEEVHFSKLECLSVLTYDTLSFSAGSLWSYFILGTFSVVAGGFIGVHPILYISTAFLYFVFFLLLVGRVCRIYFPTPEERIETEEQFERSENMVASSATADWSRNARGSLMAGRSVRAVDVEMGPPLN